MVMVVIFALAVIAGGFAYNVKVETTLARNANDDHEFEWIARSAIEKEMWALSQQLTIVTPPWDDSLDQFWATGIDITNEVFLDQSLTDVPLGRGKFTARAYCLESRFNINMATPQILERAAELIGIEFGDIPVIVDSILDWIDADDNPRPNGVETDYYQSLSADDGTPPYLCKNGPIDDLSELLLVNGITEEMFYGSSDADIADFYSRGGIRSRIRDNPVYLNSFTNLFTTTSIGFLVPMTGTNAMPLLMPDEMFEQAIEILTLSREQFPMMWTSMLQGGGGSAAGGAQGAAAASGARGVNFEIHARVTIGNRSRTMIAHAIRMPNSPTMQLLRMHWQ